MLYGQVLVSKQALLFPIRAFIAINVNRSRVNFEENQDLGEKV